MKELKSYTLLIFISLFFSSSIFSQKQQFEVGLIGGLNFSALAGEELTDFYGLNLGIISTARLSEKYKLGIAFLFSQNGEYIIPELYPPIEFSQLRLNHLEIPIHINRIVTRSRNGKSQKATFNIGAAYVHLINHKAKNEVKEDVSSQIIYNKRNAILPQAGVTFHFSPNWGFNLKATVPVNVIDWTIAVRMVYTLVRGNK